MSIAAACPGAELYFPRKSSKVSLISIHQLLLAWNEGY